LLRESLHSDVWTHCSREAVETVSVQETWATCLTPLRCIKDQHRPSAIECCALGKPGVLDLHPPYMTGRTDSRGRRWPRRRGGRSDGKADSPRARRRQPEDTTTEGELDRADPIGAEPIVPYPFEATG